MEPLVAAPYGKACVGCVRAKCKCFYRQGGTVCERCHRLHKSCEPSIAVRKRRARKESQLVQAGDGQASNRLEDKLDEVVSILRSQSLLRNPKTADHTVHDATYDTPSSLITLSEPCDRARSPTRAPEVQLDTENGHLHLLRAGSDGLSSGPIFEDVSKHKIADEVAENRLLLFRTAFLPVFPFVHIPLGTRSSSLRQQKPFLWLVMMCLTAHVADEQFKMEGMIWEIISKRIVTEHRVSMDLLQGLTAFSSWSHYFKNDTPFMTTLTSLCVSMAYELNLHKSLSGRHGGLGSRFRGQVRSLEEKRTFVAVFHVSSSTWHAYRKIEPLKSNVYLRECLQTLSTEKEPNDILLAAQVNCQLITNQLTCFSSDTSSGGEELERPPVALLVAMLDMLESTRQSLPANIQCQATTQLYLKGTELIVRDFKLRGYHQQDKRDHTQFQRIQDLDTALSLAEQWIDTWIGMSVSELMGTTVDVFTHFLHSLVVLFKLTTLDEPGWDVEAVKRRADIFEIIDRVCGVITDAVRELGLVKATGPRHGLYFKTTYLFQAMKALFLAGMAPEMRPDPKDPVMDDIAFPDFNGVFDDPNWMSNDFIMGLANEPWISDIYMDIWDQDCTTQFDVS
ncbi:hypothetical protein F5Y16DRAFT_370892 [Xylariaceae sp. FL0255]|nr:hypothetical protein F5Y16DRAFT_370892 [Xylariaceae sp. FL0255]